jgi:YbgC/YbaW family acyl-CoA thioester hydrolase
MRDNTKVRVRSLHTDDLGHLNHVAALQILQQARDNWYAKVGLWQGRDWSADEWLGTIVLNVNANYRAECFLDDEVEVITLPKQRNNKSFVLYQELLTPDARIAIDATITTLIMDMRCRKSIALPECLAVCFPKVVEK